MQFCHQNKKNIMNSRNFFLNKIAQKIFKNKNKKETAPLMTTRTVCFDFLLLFQKECYIFFPSTTRIFGQL